MRKSHTRFSQEDFEYAKIRRAQGADWKTIAREVGGANPKSYQDRFSAYLKHGWRPDPNALRQAQEARKHDERVRELGKQGLDSQQIADVIGISRRQAYRAMTRVGIPAIGHFAIREDAKVAELIPPGEDPDFAMISEKLGISRRAVSRALARLGIKSLHAKRIEANQARRASRTQGESHAQP